MELTVPLLLQSGQKFEKEDFCNEYLRSERG